MKNGMKRSAAYMNAFIDSLPEDQKKKILVDRKIKQVRDQFAACADPFILNHVNSVYLIDEARNKTGERSKKEKDPAGTHEDHKRQTKEDSVDQEHKRLILTVYVDNSTVAAELNARRELIVLKYRELFSLNIDEFVIRISRGAYRNNYPYRESGEFDNEQNQKNFRRLTPEEESGILQQTASIADTDLRESFNRVLKARKEHPSL